MSFRENLPCRESDANNESHRWADAPVSGSPNAGNTQVYARTYTYDKVGNIQSLQQSGTNAFTRTFNYTDNTLDDISVSGSSTPFTYDANGNLLTSGSSRFYDWNPKDQLTFFKIQAGGTPSVYAHYLYDAGGNRLKKIVWDQQGNKEVTVYIDGIFEYRLKQEDGDDKEQNIIHIMPARPSGGDDNARIAQKRIGNAFNDDISEAVHYILDDHLGSSTAKLNTSGGIIDRQEFYPFGDTSLRTYSFKRYRYAGKEKDSESGLYYFGQRFYSPWTCRFISCDPMKEKRAWLTPYNYVQNNPINLTDPTGALDDGGGDEPKGGNQQSGSGQGDNATTQKTQVHSVKSGETLSKIADKYGTTVEAISEANDISDPNKIQVGQKLNIGGTTTSSDNLSETFDFSTLIAQPDNTRVAMPVILDLTPATENRGSSSKGMLVNPTGGELRGQDKHGSGHYGASRSGGAREHKGIDIESEVGQDIVSPVSGTARNFTGASSELPMVDIVPSDTSLDIQLIRMLYVNAPEGQGSGSYNVKAGEKVGTQADLGKLGYPKDIVPHVHLQTDSSGVWSNPTKFFFP